MEWVPAHGKRAKWKPPGGAWGKAVRRLNRAADMECTRLLEGQLCLLSGLMEERSMAVEWSTSALSRAPAGTLAHRAHCLTLRAPPRRVRGAGQAEEEEREDPEAGAAAAAAARTPAAVAAARTRAAAAEAGAAAAAPSPARSPAPPRSPSPEAKTRRWWGTRRGPPRDGVLTVLEAAAAAGRWEVQAQQQPTALQATPKPGRVWRRGRRCGSPSQGRSAAVVDTIEQLARAVVAAAVVAARR